MEATDDKIDVAKNLSNYATWLFKAHTLELAQVLEGAYLKHNIGLFNKIAQRKGVGFTKYVEKSLEVLLQSLVLGNLPEYIESRISIWIKGEHPLIELGDVKMEDVIQIFAIQKDVCLRQLPLYTDSIKVALQISQELDSIFKETLLVTQEIYEKLHQASLTERNTFLYAIIKNINSGVAVIDRDYRYQEWNQFMEVIFDKPKLDVIGRKISEVFDEELENQFRQQSEKVLRGYLVQEERLPYHSRQGYYTRTMVPLRKSKADKEPFGILLLLQDTSEQLARQQILQDNLEANAESQKKLKRAVRQLEEAQALAHIGHWEYNIIKKKSVWSKELCRIFGLDHKLVECTYETYLQYVHPDDHKMVRQALHDCTKKNQPFTLEHRICQPSGSVRWLLSQGQLIRNKAGNAYKLRGTALDITRQKEAEITAKEEQHFIKSVTTTSPDIITVFDLNQKEIIYSNRDLYEVFGYNGEELENLKLLTGPQQIAKVIHPDDLIRVYQFLEGFRHFKGHGHREIEYRVYSPHGKLTWMLGRYTSFKRLGNGEVNQVIGILQNITVSKRNAQALQISETRLRKQNLRLEAEVTKRTQELQIKNLELTRKNLDLDNFVYTASHDLKVPISNLEGLLTLLNSKLEKGLNPRERELLGMVHTSINRLKKTITDLTDVARIQKELEEEEFDEISFKNVLEDVLADMDGMIKENSAKIHINTEIDTLNFNRKNLRSILSNLISNSIKYRHAKRKPQIYIDLQIVNNRFSLLQVRDNGTGIPEKQLPKIFTLFKRLNKTIEGSGMGLYIVKRIVENSGGYIEVFSQPEKGTTFNIYLSNQTAHV